MQKAELFINVYHIEYFLQIKKRKETPCILDMLRSNDEGESSRLVNSAAAAVNC